MDDIAEVPVHGRNLGWASSQLAGAGIPFSMGGRQGDVYIIFVPMAYMPAVQTAPWVYRQPGRLSGLAAVPWVRIILAIGFMAAAVYFCQAAGFIAGLGGLAANPDIQAAAKVKDDGSLIDRVLGRLDSVQAEIQRRTKETKQEMAEAMMSTIIMSCGVPLVGVSLLAVAYFLLRMRYARN